MWPIVCWNPLALWCFDSVQHVRQTGRFVIVDEYDIAGGGIILSAAEEGESLLERHIRQREAFWQRSKLTAAMRAKHYKQQASSVIISCEGPSAEGLSPSGKTEAKEALASQYAMLLEQQLLQQGRYAYYLAPRNLALSYHQLDSLGNQPAERSESLQRLAETAHMFCDSGAIFITTVTSLGQDEYQLLAALNQPYRQVLVQIGQGYLDDQAIQLRLNAEIPPEEGLAQLGQMLWAQGILFN